jgi:hypothetical protein
MDDPHKLGYETPLPIEKNYRRIASLVAGAGAIFGGLRAIDQYQYDPPLAWMILAAVSIILLIFAYLLWPKWNSGSFI